MTLNNKPIIAMAQPSSLPGAPRNFGEKIEEISEKMLMEISILAKGQIDGVILQNFHDGPVKQNAELETAAYMSRLACDIKREFPKLALGILVCWDGPMSVVVADASNADFVRVEHVYCGAEMTTAGIIEGQCVETQRIKSKIRSSVPVFADIYEPHSTPIMQKPLASAAYDAVYGGFADGLFACGKTLEQSIEYGHIIRKTVPSVPLICGGGSNADNVAELLKVYDGVCVGAWIKDGKLSNPVNPSKLQQYMDQVFRLRESLNV